MQNQAILVALDSALEKPAVLRAAALDAGARAANEFLRRGLIIGAALALQDEWRSVGAVQTTLAANAQPRLAA